MTTPALSPATRRRWLKRALVGGLITALPVLALALLIDVAAPGYYRHLAASAMINLMIVLGLQVYMGNSGVVHLGHSAFVGLGAYGAAILATPVAMKALSIPNAPFGLAHVQFSPLVAAALALAVVGVIALVSGLIIGGIVCTALSMAGGFVTDLKIGYWIGTTPAKQESYKFLGTLVSAATVGAVIFILNEAYGFVATPEHPNPMVAPQANAMAAIIEPLMTGSGVSWILLGIGAVIAILVNWLGVSPLAFALGMFIPLQLNTPLIVGGLLNHWINKKGADKQLTNARHQRAILISSGFIAGAALFGVLGALIIFLTGDGEALNSNLWSNPHGTGAQIVALIAFIGLVGYFVWEARRAKRED